MSASTSTPLSKLLGAAKDHVIPRSEDRDLGFRGWRISQAHECQDQTRYEGGRAVQYQRCTEVSIYVTEFEIYPERFERIVTHVRRWNQLDDQVDEPQIEDEAHAVAVHVAASQVVEWLKEDNNGRLGAISKKAWVDACRVCPPLSDEAVERV